jgi:Na+-transporting methylmalonyl-CoA/oxaloacetate decarboxylase gamma subunit
MAEQQLVDYIKKAKGVGQTDEQTRTLLYKNGWTEAEVSEAFAAVSQPQPQVQPQYQPKPQPQVQPQQPQVQPAQIVANDMDVSANKKKSRLWILGLIVVLIVLVVLIAGLAFYMGFFNQFFQKTEPAVSQNTPAPSAPANTPTTPVATQPAATPAPAWCHTFNKNLGYADSGTDEIVSLHTALDKEGFSYAPDTGNIYANGTSQALIQFQTKYGILPLSGFVGTKTRAKLNSLYGCATTTTLTPTPAPATQQATIDYITPTQASVGLMVNIYGKNFASSDNVSIGNAQLYVTPISVSPDGTNIVFVVPSSPKISPNNTYPLTLTDANNKVISNSVSFKFMSK